MQRLDDKESYQITARKIYWQLNKDNKENRDPQNRLTVLKFLIEFINTYLSPLTKSDYLLLDDCYYLMGLYHEKLKNPNEEIDCYLQSIKTWQSAKVAKNPQNVILILQYSYNALIDTLVAINALERAVEHFNEAKKLLNHDWKSVDPAAYDRISILLMQLLYIIAKGYYDKDHYDLAQSCITDIIKISQSLLNLNNKAHFTLAKSYELLTYIENKKEHMDLAIHHYDAIDNHADDYQHRVSALFLKKLERDYPDLISDVSILEREISWWEKIKEKTDGDKVNEAIAKMKYAKKKEFSTQSLKSAFDATEKIEHVPEPLSSEYNGVKATLKPHFDVLGTRAVLELQHELNEVKAELRGLKRTAADAQLDEGRVAFQQNSIFNATKTSKKEDINVSIKFNM